MAKSICLAILLAAVLCLVPGCDDADAGDSSCDWHTPYEHRRCQNASVIQACREQPDGSGAWERDRECTDNLSCTQVDLCDLWRAPPILGEGPCPDQYRDEEWTGADCTPGDDLPQIEPVAF